VDRRLPKVERQRRLRERVTENPFLTDAELAGLFDVSVQTIRLDRLALGIPELRERTKAVAERVYGLVRSIGSREIVGELIDVVPDESGISILETTRDMAFEKTKIVRSQHIFAQADSLALAIVNAEVALTGLANAKFKSPVEAGEKLIAKAQVIRRRRDKYVVLVTSRAGSRPVFRGKFVVAALECAGEGYA